VGNLENDVEDYELFLWEVGSSSTSATRLTFHTANDRWPDIFIGGASKAPPTAEGEAAAQQPQEQTEAKSEGAKAEESAAPAEEPSKKAAAAEEQDKPLAPAAESAEAADESAAPAAPANKVKAKAKKKRR
jgi:hypothetical protein